MSRPRVNPFDQGTPERILYDRWRKSDAAAIKFENEANMAMVEARALRSAADRYAEALRALGHGDKVPGQKQLPHFPRVLGEYETAEEAGLRIEPVE